MPELPEVETIRRQLHAALPGKTIAAIQVKKPSMVVGNAQTLVQKTILGVRRYSKLLIIDCSGNFSIAIHLKMTGRMIIDDIKTSDLKKEWDVEYPHDMHTHIHVDFSDESHLYFHDPRTFGYWHIISTPEIEQLPYVKTLGPEFFRNLSAVQFVKILSVINRPIKTVLLDQHVVAGVGNIYANEALWFAKIHPQRKAKTLTEEEALTVFSSLETVMNNAIIWKGASSDNFRDAYGEKGDMQSHFQIYNHEKFPCERCGHEIVKYQLGKRGTFVCSFCQK